MDQQIKERDEKYSELDSKFNRLHKRAKQRIQEVQKVTLSWRSSDLWVLTLCFFGTVSYVYAVTQSLFFSVQNLVIYVHYF